MATHARRLLPQPRTRRQRRCDPRLSSAGAGLCADGAYEPYTKEAIDERFAWVFVTENPSVLSAARQLALSGAVPRLICTSGTPSALETAAIARLHDAGWNVAVRADFDEAGLTHIQTLRTTTPDATPWRMGTDDYLATVDLDNPRQLTRTQRLRSPWDPGLADAMRRTGTPAYEEALLPQLLDDIATGRPGQLPPWMLRNRTTYCCSISGRVAARRMSLL